MRPNLGINPVGYTADHRLLNFIGKISWVRIPLVCSVLHPIFSELLHYYWEPAAVSNSSIYVLVCNTVSSTAEGTQFKGRRDSSKGATICTEM